MIKSGLGVGFFPEFAVNDPAIALTPLVEPGFARTIRLATVRGRRHSPAVGAFVRLARAHRWPACDAAPAGGSGLGRRGLEQKGEKYGAQQRHANGGDGRRPASRLKNPSKRRRARKPAHIIRSEV